MQIQIANGDRVYSVGKLLGETSHYRFYKLNTTLDQASLVLKIASNASWNGMLDREAYLLKRMREHALKLESEFRTYYPEKFLNYQIAFPYVRDSFIAHERGSRRIQILEIEAARKIEDLTSLYLIRTRDRVRVDHKTAAWILGKSLKILAFAHNFGVSVGELGGENLLIDRNSHLVMFFDWAHASRNSGGGELSKDMAQREMYLLAREVTLVMGGNTETFELPTSEDDTGLQFQVFLRKLGEGAYASADIAHKAFYQMVEGMWGRKFHPFTSIPV